MENNVKQVRDRLVNIARGAKKYYEIQYTCDAKGIITIWGGREADGSAETDFIVESGETDAYLWLYRGKHGEAYGMDLLQRQREAQKRLTRDEIVAAYLEYRRQHPQQKGCLFAAMEDARVPMYREDSAQVLQDVKRRNRAYIKEFYGEEIPIDYDFKAQYDRQITNK